MKKDKTLQKSWYPKQEDLRLLDQILESIGAANQSAALRYCIRATHKQQFEKGA